MAFTSSIQTRVCALSDQRPGEVFCLGLAIQDTIMTVAAIPTQPVKIYASARREVGGGPAATAAVAVARLGGSARLAGRIGNDATGAAMRHELDAERVDTTWLKSFEGFQSPGATILMDGNGERVIVAYADPDMPSDPHWLEPDDLGGAFLCDLSWPQGALRGLRMARAAGVPSVLDADVSRHKRDDIAAVIDAADYVVFSRPGLAQFTGTDDIETGLRLASRPSHKLTGVTDGADGLFWLDNGALANARPPEVTVVDTVGAGDAFHGALALALSYRWPLERAIAFSNAVAALKCTMPGGRAGLPSADALARFDPSLSPF
ncbi:PfkB family carbohydrate kinase [Mesorhizobium sp. CAU 1732]|uniref:PfkB family carbohydrate kinase n=1 Tax=Mesorhizobium sp. CAU 1732 TaxID=3140358 RepID=UPI00326089E8